MTETTEQQSRSGWWLWSKNPLSLVLWPLSLVFCALVALRYRLYQLGWLNSQRISKPVIVVGNISLGGNGKTPVVQALIKNLKTDGKTAGILTRGYKSDLGADCLVLNPGQTDNDAGDEANMLSELCDCPIAVGADRVHAAQQLIQQFPDLDVLIADDGLQHYALQRDIEIIVKREMAFGNSFCIPAGPLREPVSRLQRCDLVIDRDSNAVTEGFGLCWNLNNPEQTRDLASFKGQIIDSLAGIGFPELFFDGLKRAGLEVEAKAFPDHYAFSKADLKPYTDRPLLVTHKDAVKLRPFAGDNIWVVPLELSLSDELQYQLNQILESKLNG